MRRRVLHVDLDQFVAAVEVRRRPELSGLPVIVGGTGDPTARGVVSTASYQARACGVRSGMPLRTAARRCPDATFLPVDKPAYEAASQQVMAVLQGLRGTVEAEGGEHAVGAVEVLGWDEAFVAVRTADAAALARLVQRRVLGATGLHCSVGIGDNPLQAKTATGFGKPAGVFELTDATWPQVMGDRPPDALWGVGARTARALAAEGITTVGALAAADPQRLAARFGPTTGPWLVRLGRGEDPSGVRARAPLPRSRGREVTFQQDLPVAVPTDLDRVRAEVAELARQVAADLAAAGDGAGGRDAGGTDAGDRRPVVRVVVKLRTVPFTTVTRGVATPSPTRDPQVLVATALAALDRLAVDRPVRLLGVRAEFPPGPSAGPPPGSTPAPPPGPA